jgi:hypothetical protein
VTLEDLRLACRSLGFTVPQTAELEADAERALGWISWARVQRLSNPPATILTKFRTGDVAPDPNAWRGDEIAQKGSPDYRTLLRCCEALVRNTGHEYEDEDLLAEFDRLSGLTKVGNGAVLTDADRQRLLAQAERMRERTEAAR